MTPEEEIMEVLKNPAESRSLKFLALGLIYKDYNIHKIAELAKQERISQQLGYLAEVAAEAARNKGFRESEKLYELAALLYSPPVNWVYLDTNTPKFAKSLISSRPQTNLNKKWRVWDTLTSEHIEDGISSEGIESRYERQKSRTDQETRHSVNY